MNFRRELDPERFYMEAGRRVSAMRRDLADAESLARRLEGEIDETRRNLAREREELDRCRRRESLATQIGDDETARIAAEYAAIHAERAAVLEQKLAALNAELRLLHKETRTMRETLTQLGEAHHHDTGTDDDVEFRRLEDEARERAAEARLEELKRKMGR